MNTTPKPLCAVPPFGLYELMRVVEQPGWILLGAGVPSPDLLPVAPLRKAFTCANRRQGRLMWAYQKPGGNALVREWLAQRLTGRGVRCRADDIVLTTGCTEALHILLSLVVKPGDVVMCEQPAYYNLLEQIHHLGAAALQVPLREGVDADVDRALFLAKQYKARCLVVCSTLSNPSGGTLDVAAREQLVRGARELGMRIIDDDIYAELHESGAPPPLRHWDAEGRTVAWVSSFCKTVAPGFRVGMMLPWSDLQDVAARRKCMIDMHGATMSEATLGQFLVDGGMEPHLRKLKRVCRARRRILADAAQHWLPRGTRIYNPDGGFLLWVETPMRIRRGQWNEVLARARVTAAPGWVFSLAVRGALSMRLNAARADEQDLERGMRRLARALSQAD